jgi:hypothetical protein
MEERSDKERKKERNNWKREVNKIRKYTHSVTVHAVTPSRF